jgi:hypothetical protein
MTDLKLPKIPDRMPVKLTIAITPDLNLALADYTELYRETYGQSEQVSDLIPFMVRAFLESDRAFLKARQAKRGN